MDLSACYLNVNIAHGPGSDGQPGKISKKILENGIVEYVKTELLPMVGKVQGISFHNPWGEWNDVGAMHFDQLTIAKAIGPVTAWDGWNQALKLLNEAFPNKVIAYVGELKHYEGMSNVRAYTDGETYKAVQDPKKLPDGSKGTHRKRVSFPEVQSIPWKIYLRWAKKQIKPILRTGTHFSVGITGGFPEDSNRGKFLKWIKETKGQVYMEPVPLLEHAYLNASGFTTFSHENYVDWQNSENWEGRVKVEDLVENPHILLVKKDTTSERITTLQNAGWILHIRRNIYTNLS